MLFDVYVQWLEMISRPFSSSQWLPFNDPMGASSLTARDRPSSRGTSTARISYISNNIRVPTYEKPHGCAEASRHESVEGSHRVDVDGVVRVRAIFGRTHADS